MADKVKKMKAAIDANRKAAGESPRPKDMRLVPRLKKLAALKDDLDSVPAHVAPGPEKPSEAAEAVEKTVLDAAIEHCKDDWWNNLSLSRAIAVAIVRRFPGLTQKPKSKTRKCCGTLVGPGPHRPDCVQLTHAKPDPAQE